MLPEADVRGPGPPSLRADLWRALGSLTGPPTPEQAQLADALEIGSLPEPSEHTEVFLLQLPPYASPYLGPEGMLGGEARDRIAGFWTAVGRTPPTEPDHLACLLGLYAALEEESREGSAASRLPLLLHAREALLREHLVPWLFPYLLKLEEVAGPFYRSWATLLRRLLEDEVRWLGAVDELPRHLEEAPGLEADSGDADQVRGSPGSETASGADALGSTRARSESRPRSGREEHRAGTEPRTRDDLAGRLLTPVRSGLILTRADLARAARTRDLPLRIGERRFALRNMLSAAPGEALKWLSDEAERWAERHAGWEAFGGAAARFWRARAEATGKLLVHLVRARV